MAQHEPNSCHDWTAIHDFMPPQPPRLRVRGKCTFPTPGFQVTLTKHVPPGINPTVLILDKKVTAPTGIEPQHVVTIDVAFEEQTSVHYVEVLIEPDGTKIKVEEVT